MFLILNIMKDSKIIIYKGKKRPFLHVCNYGDIYLYGGDKVEIRKIINNYYLNVNDKLSKWHVTASSVISYSKYGIIEDKLIIDFIEDMLKGKYKTSLEIDLQAIKNIKNNLPKEDFKIIKWQSNYYYPVSDIIYKDGMYLDTTYHYNEPETAENLAWIMYYNAINLLPKEFYDSDNSTMYENSINLNY